MPDHSFAARSSWPHPFDHLEEANPARDQTATEPAAVGTNQDGFSLGDVRDWQPPARELGRFIPPGMVSAACQTMCHAQRH